MLAEQEVLERVLTRIRQASREEWIRRIEAYENETGDEPLNPSLVNAKQGKRI